MLDLLVLGAGGHAKVVIDAALETGLFRISYVVDEFAQDNKVILGYPVIKALPSERPDAFIVAIGDNATRKREYERLLALGWEPAAIVHPTVIAAGVNLGGDTQIGEGTLLGVGARTRPHIRILDWSTVGGGAVVVDHVPSHTTVVGVPAKPLPQRAAL